MITEAEIEAAKTESAGWTRETLKLWGVEWPPRKGWKKRLIDQWVIKTATLEACKKPGVKVNHQTEDQIHISILEYLALVLPEEASPVWHTPNGGARDARTGAKMKRLGVKAGFPDLAFLCRSSLYTLEVKTEKGRLSARQKHWQQYIENAGGFYEVVRSIDDTRAALVKWGIIKK